MPELRATLTQLVRDLRAPDVEKIGRSMPHPLSGKPGYVYPDPYPPGATDEQIAIFSDEFGIQIPYDVREWLKITDGAAGFLGIASTLRGWDIASMWKQRPHWYQKQWIPVGSDLFGNFYLRVPDSADGMRGGVCFVEGTISHELAYAVASDTLHLAYFVLDMRTVIKSYKETYGWPFDRDFVISRDPQIADVNVAPLPWDL
jgi:cell wall assembly regulator SMI1